MDTNELCSARVTQTSDVFAIAGLTAKLNLLVDQMEIDWAERTAVGEQTAARIRDLREEAERLFGTIE